MGVFPEIDPRYKEIVTVHVVVPQKADTRLNIFRAISYPRMAECQTSRSTTGSEALAECPILRIFAVAGQSAATH